MLGIKYDTAGANARQTISPIAPDQRPRVAFEPCYGTLTPALLLQCSLWELAQGEGAGQLQVWPPRHHIYHRGYVLLGDEVCLRGDAGR